jgi:predicted HTH domain antitoxin
MLKTTFQVQVPQSLLQFGFNQIELQRLIIEWMVLSLFTDERISSGKAARLLNITRVDFLKLLKKRGIAFIDYSADEMTEELAAVQSLEVKITR